MLVLDDLHWADPASLDLLRVVARGLGDAPLLLLVTHRSDELPSGHSLTALLPRLVREAGAARLDLRPLDDTAARALVAARHALTESDLARLATYLQGRAEGNPFYLGELLRALAEEATLRPAGDGWALGDLGATPVPPLLRQVIAERATRLGEEARRLLALAAVIGQVVPLAVWQVVGDVAEGVLLDVVERAVEAHLLVVEPDGAGVRFAHALTREALYEEVLSPRRRVWHRRIAEALAAEAQPDPDAVAYHFLHAGDDRAAEWLVRAGERAQRAYAWLTAAARFEAALALPALAVPDPRERARLLLTLAQFWRYEDRHRGLGYLDEAERLAEAAGDTALAAAARFDRGHLQLLGRDSGTLAARATGLAAMVAALPVLEALTPAERAQLPALRLQGVRGEERYHRGALMYWLAGVGRFSEVLALAAPLLADSPEVNARGLAGLGLAYYSLGRPDEAERALAEAEARFQAAGQHVEVYYRLAERLLVACAYYVDRPARWQPLLARIKEAERRAAGAWRVEPHAALLRLHLVRGDWAEARRLAAGHSDDNRLLAAMGERHQGETATARAVIERYLPDGPATAPGSHNPLTVLVCQQLAAALALDAGDLPAAHRWLEAHDRWLAWSGSVLYRAEGALGWAAYHRAAGDLALAREHAEAALAHASEPRQPLALLAAHRARGEIATAAGHHAEAAGRLQAALALADACAAPYERALTLLAVAESHAATGARGEARAPLAEARAILAPLEAKPALARADALAARLAALPVPARSAAPVYPAGLSRREVAVLGLVAQGLTDAQVAERLYLSRHTVSAHLRAIYGKLGVENRAAATRFAVEHHLL